jgi:hypothetical protein
MFVLLQTMNAPKSFRILKTSVSSVYPNQTSFFSDCPRRWAQRNKSHTDFQLHEQTCLDHNWEQQSQGDMKEISQGRQYPEASSATI